MTVTDAFRILELRPSATWSEIRQAYLDLSRVWHPDRLMHDPRLRHMGLEKIKDINAAYGVLKQWCASRENSSATRGSGHAKAQSAYAPPYGNPLDAYRDTKAPLSGFKAKLRARVKYEFPTFAFSAASAVVLALIGFFVLNVLHEQSALDQHHMTSAPAGWSGSAQYPVGLARPSLIPVAFPAADSGDRGDGAAPAADKAQARPKVAAGKAKPAASPSHNVGASDKTKYESAIEPTQVGGPHGTTADVFTVGSTADEVLAIQGPPTNIKGSVWHYGPSWVYFKKDLVTGWHSSQSNRLRARITPPTDLELQRTFFSIGSTAKEVWAVQGAPTIFNHKVWHYGESKVYFENGLVTSWDISPLRRLKARMLPSAPVETERSFFSLGSSSDEVLALQGTPTSFKGDVWFYGLSRVDFRDGRVIGWHNSYRARLNVAMPPQREVDPQRAFFSVGSTPDEVLALQGTPTIFNAGENVWHYGLSKVEFKNGRVARWHASAVNPLRAHLLSSN